MLLCNLLYFTPQYVIEIFPGKEIKPIIILLDDCIIFHCFIKPLVHNPLQASWVYSETSSQTQREGKDQRKRQGTPGL